MATTDKQSAISNSTAWLRLIFLPAVVKKKFIITPVQRADQVLKRALLENNNKG